MLSARVVPRAGSRACPVTASLSGKLGRGRYLLRSRSTDLSACPPDHRADKKARLLATLGMDEPEPGRYTWHVVTPSDHDHLPYDRRLLYIIAERTRLKAAYDEARRRPQETAEASATGRAA
jgi:hypothetical protein